MSQVVFGIDYGSKLTGNTVISVFNDGDVFFLDMSQGVDADSFILNAAEHFMPSKIFIDAPLSLPGVYRNLPGFNNYHFRKADLELNAMSPMFLGGLAARAIELKSRLKSLGLKVFETYPIVMANQLKLRDCDYKGSLQNLSSCAQEVINILPASINIDKDDIKTWHHLDALLALISAINSLFKKPRTYGHREEGLIYI
ncbi:hypothetical protein [Owenweeksia hongkongensis]|uniref:hypothetical protein n=1 Tax=Owenweeksia hongkongensis TaxID=253245 RepID=UPI003A8DFB35